MAKKISKIDLIEAGTFEQLRKDIESTKTSVDVLKTALETVNTISKEIKKNASSTKKTASGIDPSDPKNLKLLNDEIAKGTILSKQAAEADKLKTTVKRALTVEEQKHKLVLAAANAESKKVAQLKLAEKNSIEALRAKLSLVTVAWSKLTKEEIENTKRGQRLFESKKKLTDQIGKLERATGDHRRNVGNYGSALDGLKGKFSRLIGVASQFGLALGGVAILKGAIETISTFNSAIADLSAITGASGADLDKYKKAAIEMGNTTKGGAAAVVEAFKLIGSAKPELLANADALIKVTDAAKLLSKASGMELPDAAANLTDAMNQFGAGADQASKFVNVLAAGSKFGAAEIPQITEALLKFGAVAKTSNVSIEESTALIESLAEKGLKGAEAGTALRNVMLKLSAPDALPKEAQQMLQDLGVDFEKLKDTSKPFAERLDALKPILKDNAALIKVFGTENAVAAVNLISSTERIKELNEQVTGTQTAFEQASVRSKTLSEAYNSLKETVNGTILSFADGVDAASGFAGALDFIRVNLGSIISVTGNLIKVFLIYKGVQAALKLKESYQNWKLNSDAIKKTGENLTDAQKSAKGFGGALKGIGLSVAIGLAIELALAFYDVASGADVALAKTKAFDLYKAGQAGKNKRFIDGITEEIDANNKMLELRVANKEISQEQADLDRKAFLKEKRFFEEVSDFRTGQTKTENFDIFGKIQRQVDEVNRQIVLAEADIRSLESDPLKNRLLIGAEKGKIKALKESRGELYAYNQELKNELHNLNVSTIASKNNTNKREDNNSKITKSTRSTKENTEAIDNEALALKENTDLLDYRNELLDDFNSQMVDVVGEDIIDLPHSERLLKEYEILLLESSKSQEEIANDLRDFEIRILKERQLLFRDLKISTIDIDLEIAKKEKAQKESQNNKLIKLDKDRFDNQKKYINLTNDYLKRSLDNRIAMLQQEVEASQRKEDDLREQANNGNINAQQSIAEQERIRNEAFKNQAKLTQRKAQLEAVTAFFTSYLNAKEAGKTSTEAFAEASLDKITLESILATLPTFLKGTEDTGTGGILDNDGGFHAILHPNERVMTKEQNIGLGGLSNAEVVSIVQNSKLTDSMSTISSDGWGNLKVLAELNGLKSELSEVRKAIENKPVTDIQLGQITQKTMEIIHSTKQGNRTTRSIFKVK